MAREGHDRIQHLAILLLQMLDLCPHSSSQVFSYLPSVALHNSLFSTEQANRPGNAFEPIGQQLSRRIKQLSVTILPVRKIEKHVT